LAGRQKAVIRVAMSKPLAWTVWAVTALLLGCFFVWPILTTVQRAFFDSSGNFTLVAIREVFANRIYVEGLWNSFALACASTAVTLVIALPLAFLSDRYDFAGKKALSALLLVPMILPPFVGAIGVRQMLGQYGALNSLLTHLGLLDPGSTIDWLGRGQFWGCVILNALHLCPILFLNLTAALANVDPAMEEAAENLGCTGWRKFRRITLPLIMPGLFAGGTIVFIFAFTELGTPLIFDYSRVTSVQIFYGIKEISGNPFPFALVVVMLCVTALLYAASKLLFGRSENAMTGKAGTAGTTRTLGGAAGWLCALAFAGVTFLALLPHIGVVLESFSKDWYRTVLPGEWTTQHYSDALGHYLTVPSITNSLKYAGLSVIVDIVLGLAIAYVIVRTKLPGRQTLDTVSMLPLAVPGLVLAFGYISMTQPSELTKIAWIITSPITMPLHWMGNDATANGIVDGLAKFMHAHLNVATDPTLLLVIAYSVRRLPYVVRSVVAGLQQTSETLEEAAQNLGCPPLRTLSRITFPLIAANVLAGALLAFSFAMLEVSDSLILAQKQQHFPITKAIYELFQMIGDGKFLAAALGVWAMVFLGLTIAVASRILGKKMGALFRA
jgi:iron(III) transport system permease protein